MGEWRISPGDGWNIKLEVFETVEY